MSDQRGCPSGPPGVAGSPGAGPPFPEFVKRLSDLSLVALRHDAIRDGDAETQAVIDAEMKRRVTPAHQWQFYMNGSFCTRCGAQIGDGRPCR